jgi:hypothetical protein
MLSNVGWLTRSAVRDFQEEVQAGDRFIDVGAVITVVRADPKGTALIPGRDIKLTAVGKPHEFGGVVDTRAERPRIVGRSRAPAHWFCSEEQWQIIRHAETEPLGQLVVGSEGAGKTTCGVLWTYLRWMENLGEFREGGITAPTETRLGLVLRELFLSFPQQWYRFQSSTNIVTLCDGTRLRAVSTYQQSESQGSRIQGFNWSWCFRDEAQDQVRVHADIEARGRSAKAGRFKQLGTATAKDDSEWRTLRDQLVESGHWVRRTLLGPRSPFVDPSHWERTKLTMSAREYKRRVLAQDVPPETAVYPEWNRETGLITPQDLGWTDVTRHELRGAGPNHTMLVGHDPGLTVDVSLFMRAYVTSRNEQNYHAGRVRPFWVVLGELNTERSTTEAHITKLLESVRERWQLNLLDRRGRVTSEVNQILVHADPAGNTDTRTDKSVYTQFANAQIRCRPAAWNSDHTGHGRVPREAGVELVNTLLCNAAGERRLFVARNADGSPAAPMLVKALEQSERDEAGRAENSRKGKGDVTHWPAALRYALWAIERPRLQLQARES